MKTITLFLIIAFALSIQAQNQTIGFAGGISVSSILYKKSVENPAKFKIGHIYKLNYEVEIFDHVFIATGVTLQEKGFTNQIGGNQSYIKFNNTHRYLGIPIGVGFEVGDAIYLKLMLQVNLSVLIDHESYVELFANNTKYEEHYFYKTDQYTPFDFSIIPSARLGYRFDNYFGLFLEGSFSASANSFFNEKQKAFSFAVSNFAFSACVGIDVRM